MKTIPHIATTSFSQKRVLLRADFDVSFDNRNEIADDIRIRSNLPTIKHLLAHHNRIICVAKLNRPERRDPKHSLAIVVKRLQAYLPEVTVRLIDDFLTEPKETFTKQTEQEILVLENIRFYPGEKKNDKQFAEKLASLADIYVNDAFAMSHREEASIVGVPTYLPSYAGLLLQKEIETITHAMHSPKRPLVAIIGGSKISTKITLINKLIEATDFILLGGGLANVFFQAKGYKIGTSICEKDMVEKAKELLFLAAEKQTALLLPTDALIGNSKDTRRAGQIITLEENTIPDDKAILDIGPETQARYGNVIAHAKTIIWNGPMGLFESPPYRQGTDFIYYALAQTKDATTIVGGGDTLSAISDKAHVEALTHISTGGGAMLEFIEKGTLPGVEALKH